MRLFALRSGGGAGTVTGPVSSTDNAIVRWDGTTGSVVQNSTATIDDSGNLSLGAGDLSQIKSVSYSWPAANAAGALTNNGSGTLTWTAVTATPGGSNTQIQFNDSSAFGGSAKFTFNKTTAEIIHEPGAVAPQQILYLKYTGLTTGGGTTFYGVNLEFASDSAVNQTVFRNSITAGGGSNRYVRNYSAVVNGGTWTNSSQTVGYYSLQNTDNNYPDMDPVTSAAGTAGGFLDSGQNNTAGVNFGAVLLARNGNKNVGVYGYAKDGTGTTPQNYGGRFIAVQETGAQSVGVYGRIRATASSTTEKANPGVSAAGVFDNGDTTGDMLVLQDAGTTKIKFTDVGNSVLAEAARATTATNGFVYIPTCAGTPTGAPTAYTGTCAMIYDTTNNVLYVYNAAWKGVILV